MANAPKKKPRYWKSLPKEDKKGVVRALLEAGYTREAIGTALGTTKNAVVGFQHSHLSDMTGKFSGTIDDIPAELLSELLLREWPLEKIEPTLEQPKERTPINPRPVGNHRRTTSDRVRPKIAASEATQCTHRDDKRLRCAFEWTDPVTRVCDIHE